MIEVRGRFRNVALRGIDALLASVVPSAQAPERPERPRVLVIRCDHLGDATLSSAPLQAIRDALSPSRMDVLCGPWAVDVFRNHPAVDEVLTVAAPWWLVKGRTTTAQLIRAWMRLPRTVRMLRGRRYDIGIDLRGDLRHFVWFLSGAQIPERISSDRTGGKALLTMCVPHRVGVHEVLRMDAIAAAVGATTPGRPLLRATPLTEARRRALGLPPVFVAVAPRGASANRQWPSAHVAELARLVQASMHLPTVYLGGEADVEHAAEATRLAGGALVNIAGQTSVVELVAIIDEARCVVAMDSGPMHIAAAMGRPLVALWGPGSPSLAPWSCTAVTVTSTDGCACTGPACMFTEGAGRCFRAITADRVNREVLALGASTSP